MKNAFSKCLPLAVAAALAAGPALSARAQTAAPAAEPQAVNAKIILADKDSTEKRLELMDRKGDSLFYREPGGPANVLLSIKTDGLAEVVFDLKYDEAAVGKASVNREWQTVANTLLPAVLPLQPFIDLKNNNGVELAAETGSALMKAASALATQKEPDRARIQNVYGVAYRILKNASLAKWWSGSESVAVKAILCRIAMGELKEAARDLDACREPDVGDGAYGLYWLAHGQLSFANRQYRPAIDAAVKSLVFENKDIDSFPEALMLCARCYQELLEYYRARDVYYEIARLFPNTEWDGPARARLQDILDKGLTKEQEQAPIEYVFFGLMEDVNAKAEELLSRAPGEAETEPGSIEEEETEDSIRGIRTEKKEKPDENAPMPVTLPPAPPPAAPPAVN